MSNTTPFGMSFDELVAQAQAAGGPQTSEGAGSQAQTAGASQNSETAQVFALGAGTAAAGAGMSFDEMVSAAQKVAGSAPAVEPPAMNPPTGSNAEDAPKEEGTSASGPLSFEELVAQASAAANMGGTAPKAEEKPAEETPKAEEKPAEEKAEEKPAEEKAEEKPVEETAKAEEKPAEKKAKKSKGKSAKKAKPEEKPEETPKDQTESYRVDLGQAKEKPEESVKVPASMEALFTPEEVAALRADIRTLVRSEIKRAMVEAVKELLRDFEQ